MATQRQVAKTRQPGKAQARKAAPARQAAPSGRAPQPGKTGQPGRNGQPGKTAQPGKTDQQGKTTQPDTGKTGSLWHRLIGYVAGHKLESTTLLVSVLGLAVSIYLTIAHYTTTAILACSARGTIDCAAVTTSPQSRFLGMPVAVLGLAFFIFMVAVNSPRAWRATLPAVHWARLGSVIIGMVFVLWLIYAELLVIGHICLYCTSVHVLTFILFGLIITRVAASGVKAVPDRR